MHGAILLAVLAASTPSVSPRSTPPQTSAPTFDFNPGDFGSGPSLLSNVLTINGTTMTVVADYDARNISGTSWTASAGVAGTLSVVGSNTAPVPEQPAPFTEQGARAVTYAGNSNKLHDGASTAIGTLDYAIEWVFTQDATSAAEHYGFTDWDNTAVKGFLIGSGTGNSILKVYHADGTLVSVSGASTMTLGAWQDVMCFFKRTGNVRCYLNGAVEIAGTAISARTASITNTVGLGIGGGADSAIAANTWPGKIAIARGWTCSACLNTTAQMDAVAQQRFDQLTGIWPQVCAGACAPVVQGRATAAMFDVDRDRTGIRLMFLVGAGWMRNVQHFDNNRSIMIRGYLAETAATNLLLRNDALDNASWTKTQCSATADTTVAPTQSTTADSLTATSGAGSVDHFGRQPATLTATTYTQSAFVRPGAGIETHAWVRDNTVANAIGWIKLAGCVAGTKGAGVTTITADSYGNGWCRLGITFTGTAASHSLDFGFSNADNVTTYDDGTNTSTISVWCPQVEANPTPTACILTTSASVTRNKDDLEFNSVTNVVPGIGTVEASAYCPSYSSGSALRLVSIGGSGGSGADRRELYATNSTGRAGFDSFTATISQASIIASSGASILGGVANTLRGTWAPNRFQGYLNGVSIGTDTSGTTPSADGSIYIGESSISAVAQPACAISRVRVYPIVVPP